ncbi:hypothetical protein [Halorhabdus salina]|uniref:hypothetical protein n=1 Tax=Halorhabdus salina TaxID=2750670 RepID=UPI0015EEC7CA|nr:hypothetical protein [Halorhabdus salina]
MKVRERLDRWAKAKGKSQEWFREGNVLTNEWAVGEGNHDAYTWWLDHGDGEFNPRRPKHEFDSETL